MAAWACRKGETGYQGGRISLAGTAQATAAALWRARHLGLLGAVALIALPASSQPADARGGTWFGPAYYTEDVQPVVRKKKRRHARRPSLMAPEPSRNAAKPKGPLLIAVSIDKQRLKIYDADGVWAEAPVSTGMRGHSTPTGVFSIIQKSKWHRSNIYSGAPMPYMQRITWSGVALHAGALPGYPASHGCIRLPASFAAQLWTWTKLGARVVITRGEATPIEIAHPRLIARVALPPPAEKVTEAPEAPVTAMGRRKLAMQFDDAVRNASASMTDAREELRLASVVDAADDGAPIARDPAAAPAEQKDKAEAAETKPVETKPAETPSAAAAPVDPKAAESKPEEGKPVEAKSVEAKPAESTSAEAKPSETKAPEGKPAEAAAPADPAKPATAAIPEPKRSGHIAAFVSRKEGKLYVRQGFENWFQMPITIAQADKPIGTHVFTARLSNDDPNLVRWTAVSLPPDTPAPPSRRKGKAAEAEAPPVPTPVSAEEALERINIPQEVLDKIAAVIGPGASLTIADQGLGPETGLGTDFIVLTR